MAGELSNVDIKFGQKYQHGDIRFDLIYTTKTIQLESDMPENVVVKFAGTNLTVTYLMPKTVPVGGDKMCYRFYFADPQASLKRNNLRIKVHDFNLSIYSDVFFNQAYVWFDEDRNAWNWSYLTQQGSD